MPAKTGWWYCGVCGFTNHPRDPRTYGQNLKINDTCEQCGALRSHPDALDYQPRGVGNA